jgi:hypothetical protein
MDAMIQRVLCLARLGRWDRARDVLGQLRDADRGTFDARHVGAKILVQRDGLSSEANATERPAASPCHKIRCCVPFKQKRLKPRQHMNLADFRSAISVGADEMIGAALSEH